MRERAQGISAGEFSPTPYLSCSQEPSSRALLQAAAAHSLAQALPVQRLFLLGPILSYSLASTFLSLQFHPLWNSLIHVSWFKNSLIWRRIKNELKHRFLPRLVFFKGLLRMLQSTLVNVREARQEQAGAHPAGSQSQQGSPAACGTAGHLGTEHTEH